MVRDRHRCRRCSWRSSAFNTPLDQHRSLFHANSTIGLAYPESTAMPIVEEDPHERCLAVSGRDSDGELTAGNAPRYVLRYRPRHERARIGGVTGIGQGNNHPVRGGPRRSPVARRRFACRALAVRCTDPHAVGIPRILPDDDLDLTTGAVPFNRRNGWHGHVELREADCHH